MPYLGNNLQAAYQIYQLIDDISASFNGVTTSFPLRVSGVTPAPFPINPQQCLINIAGVPQQPDPTGTSGFRFSGSNIVFVVAPTAGQKFWGVILAGADYINAGGEYPNGSAAAPSITFGSNPLTGLYLSSSNVLGFATAGTSAGVIDSSGNWGIGRTSAGAKLHLNGTFRFDGSSSGYTELRAPAAAGSNTLTLPTGNGSADQVISGNGSGALSWTDRGRMVLETAKASTSGTSIDFTGIPSWVKRVTVMLNGVSTNGTSPPQIQLGTSSGVVTTGYAGSNSIIASIVVTANFTSGFGIGVNTSNWVGAWAAHGCISLFLLGANTWAASGVVGISGGSATFTTTGSVTLSGTLDRIRITTVNGTDTFDAGSINILYEG